MWPFFIRRWSPILMVPVLYIWIAYILRLDWHYWLKAQLMTTYFSNALTHNLFLMNEKLIIVFICLLIQHYLSHLIIKVFWKKMPLFLVLFFPSINFCFRSITIFRTMNNLRALPPHPPLLKNYKSFVPVDNLIANSL